MTTIEATRNGAPVTGALTFAVTSLVFLAIASLMLAGRPGFLLGETLTGHGEVWILLLVYGFALPAVFAAVYWALPSAFGLPLFSNQAVFLHYGFHLAGLMVALILPFVPDLPQAGMAATFIACGGIVFIVNASMTLTRMERPDVASAYLSTVMVWLAVVVFLGLPFAKEPPLPLFAGTQWTAGWMVFLVAGVLFNTLLGLALRVTPSALGAKPRRSAAAWYALAILNAGVAWMFGATTFGPLPFLLLCTTIFLAGSLIYLADFWGLLQSRPDRGTLAWEAKILLAAVWMVPTSGLLLMLNAWERLGLKAEAVVDPAAAEGLAEIAGPVPVSVAAMDWTVALAALLATAVPGLVAILFQLQKIRPAAAPSPGVRERVAGSLLLAAFFNYAVGAGLLVVGAWGAEEQMLGLGAVFLVVGTLGFLGIFLHNVGSGAAAREASADAVTAS